MGVLFATLSAASWGISNIFARKGLEDKNVDACTGLFISLLVNNVMNVLIISVYLAIGGSIHINLPGMLLFMGGGILNSCAGRGILFASISMIGASRGGVLKATYPLYAVLGGVFLLGERVSGRVLIGIAIILGGIILISLETAEKKGILAVNNDAAVTAGGGTGNGSLPIFQQSMSKKGIALGLLASFFLGSGNVFRKAGLAYIPSSLVGVSAGALVALFFITAFQLWRGKKDQLILALKKPNIAYYLVGVFTSFGLYSLFLALKLLPISLANPIASSEPLFTMLASLIILGEKEVLTIRTFLLALVIIAGVVILVTS